MRNRVLRAISLLTMIGVLSCTLSDGALFAATAKKEPRKPAAPAKKSAAAKPGQAKSGQAKSGQAKSGKAISGKPKPVPVVKKKAVPAKVSNSRSARVGSATTTTPRSKSAAVKTAVPARKSGGATLKSKTSRSARSQGVIAKGKGKPSSGGVAAARKSASRRSAARENAALAAFDPGNPRTLRAEAAVVVDTRTMKVVWSKNPHAQRPVASLTKLMTALVVLDHRVDLSDSVTVSMGDVTGAGHSHVRAGNRVSVGDLLRCSLISSDNAATRALARSTGLEAGEFVRAMNAKARALDLRETRYDDPTGLSAENRSTAADQARLIITAADNPLISQITSTPSYTFLCGRRIETLTNTNRLLRSRSDIVGSKTGFINSAGYCLAVLIGDRDDPYLTTVVLGAPSNSSRFVESTKLINWALSIVGPTPALASPRPGGMVIPAGSSPATYRPPIRR